MFCCNRRWIAKNGINDCGIKYFASHMQCRKNCNFKEIVLSQLLKSDAVLFLRRSTGPMSEKAVKLRLQTCTGRETENVYSQNSLCQFHM
jgi:hypothetical protein